MPVNDEYEKRLEKLESKVDNVIIRVAVAENDIGTIKDTLNKINSNTTWLLRIVIGAIILAVLGLVIVGAQLPNT